MIVVCEPQMKGMSHEKVNSGFLYGIRLAYPQDKILFYADETHIVGIKSILENDQVTIDNIEYLPIKFHNAYGFMGMAICYFYFKKIFTTILLHGITKIFFLSTNPVLLYLIKRLKKKTNFQNIQCAIVLHGEFESVAHGEPKKIPSVVFPGSSNEKNIEPQKLAERINRLATLGVKGIARKITKEIKMKVKAAVGNLNAIYSGLFERYFYIGDMLLWRHSKDFHYIVLSPHALQNAVEYIDVNGLNFYGIVMPIVFAKPFPQASNDFVKFATFGYGDSSMLYQLASLLSQKEIKHPYEIRVIGMDHRGTEGFSHIHCVGQGEVMPRSEMEKHVPDVDIFLILYDKSRYRLSCSGSILEALSYTKPVFHLSNDSVNYFNREENPIGISCVNLEELADSMVDIINNYLSYKGRLEGFRENILNLRRKIAIEELVPEIKGSFTFD